MALEVAQASDDSMADVWYNIGQVAIGIGDLGLAYQAFKISISVDSSHAESYANLGVLELRKGNIEAARSNFRAVQTMAPHMFEPFFNGALLAYKLGDFQESFELATKALSLCEGHHDSLELLKQCAPRRLSTPNGKRAPLASHAAKCAPTARRSVECARAG